MAPGPGIVCQKLPNRTAVPRWCLLEKRQGQMSYIKEIFFFKSTVAMVTASYFQGQWLFTIRQWSKWEQLKAVELPLIAFSAGEQINTPANPVWKFTLD